MEEVYEFACMTIENSGYKAKKKGNQQISFAPDGGPIHMFTNWTYWVIKNNSKIRI